MYVYCDVATHTIIGDTKTPLLRVSNVSGSHGDTIRETLLHSHYVPVGRREFDTTEIAIKQSDHFYLTLSSGVTKLPEGIRLDGDYEVAISHFAYPHNWFNVNNGDNRYWIGTYNLVTNQFPFPKFFVKSGTRTKKHSSPF
jgi:hypothetical protein